LYHLTQTIPLGGGVKWDYLHFDAATQRVFISQGDELTVVDAHSGKISGHVTGLRGSHGIAIDPKTGFGYADSSDTKTISIFNLKTLTVVQTMPALEDADGMLYDSVSDQVFVVGGDAAAMLAIDPHTNKVAKTIALGGKPEFLVSDEAGSVYVNISDKNQIVRLDTRTDAITARWRIAPCHRAVGLAIDAKTRRLFSSCANALMMVADADDGKIVAQLPIGKGTDSAAFDPVRARAFSANRDGTLSIIQEHGGNDVTALAAVKTALGARTMAVDPASGRIFLVTASVASAGPPKQPGGVPNYKFAPGTARLLILDPTP
jgi:DNA-binding beta-propeller fold protein YncE